MKAFVVTRDRVAYARRCVDALLTAGLDVVIVDHGSTWPPMVDWLRDLDTRNAHWSDNPWVVWDVNRHPRDLWRLGGPLHRASLSSDERFIVTDCDVVPDEACPADWPARMAATLDRYPAVRKVGLGLRTDDLPAHFQHADMVRTWEAQYQAVGDGGRLNPLVTADVGAVIADIDTTLAMYRWYEPFTLGPAVRLRPPYVARHLPWYEDTLHLDEEQQYYRDHAAHGHWRSPTGYADDYKLRS